ncbi:MAG: N-acetyl-gamma-glutamyl-phosphate reductase [Proteobacteria bacterium]|nr:N-acetyl-gamma-glutamyl-phosphate reductase [Pseudomonadota bacterium]
MNVAVVGASGYTGCELLRLLRGHPQVQVRHVTSRRLAGSRIDDLYPQFYPWPQTFDDFSPSQISQCDLVFFAAPAGVAMEHAPALIEAGVRVIDLSADFRLRDVELWQRWYGMEHRCPSLAARAVYGLTEFARQDIAKAQLIANPGCYPTAVGTALVPLIEAGALAPGMVVADCKSGASGAGRTVKEGLLYCELNESVHAYAVSGHRHQAEIDYLVGASGGGLDVRVQFVPHILPMQRGMLATLYVRAECGSEGLRRILDERYNDEEFVQVYGPERVLRTADVCRTNLCAIAVYPGSEPDMTIVVSVIDNLVKGAAGQAVQNMNCCYGWPENTGLTVAGQPPVLAGDHDV